jgi:hypothetical protein
MTSCTSGSLLGYEEPKGLDKYLQEFKSAASERGYPFSIPDKFKVKLVKKIEGRTTIRGSCTEDIPMVIRLEKDYWMQADSTQRKILLFHEFGHCLLNRSHTNAILPNGEWKSLIRGGKLAEKRSYIINFRDFRKEYYWDELFNPETSIPSWATRSQKLKIDTKTFSEITKLNDFENLSQKWAKPDTVHANYIIENSNYTIKNRSNQKLAVTSIGVPVTLGGNFVIDYKIILTLSNSEEGIGVIFGERDSLEYIAITPKLGVKLGNLFEFRPLNRNSQVESYRITIQNLQNELLYFVDDELVYHKSAKPFMADSLYVGYYVAPNNTLKVTDIEILWK